MELQLSAIYEKNAKELKGIRICCKSWTANTNILLHVEMTIPLFIFEISFLKIGPLIPTIINIKSLITNECALLCIYKSHTFSCKETDQSKQLKHNYALAKKNSTATESEWLVLQVISLVLTSTILNAKICPPEREGI